MFIVRVKSLTQNHCIWLYKLCSVQPSLLYASALFFVPIKGFGLHAPLVNVQTCLMAERSGDLGSQLGHMAAEPGSPG